LFSHLLVSALTLAFSESCLDTFPQDNFSYLPQNQESVAKWVLGASPVEELVNFQDCLEMNPADAFELKHDTLSEYSMDSAYQSQSGASQRRNPLPEYQNVTPQDNRSHTGNQSLFSPTLESDHFLTFQEQQTDMSQMRLSSSTTESQNTDYPFSFYGNYSAGQETTQYTATNVSRFAPASGMDAGHQWGMADSSNISAYDYPSYAKSSHSIDGSMFASADAELMFNPTPRQLSRPQINTNVRPAAVRHSSSYASSQGRQTNQTFGPVVMSPTSPLSAHLPLNMGEFEQHSVDLRYDAAPVAGMYD
jgi:hypothetical protein